MRADLEAIIKVNHKKFISFALARLGNVMEAEDLVHDYYVETLEKMLNNNEFSDRVSDLKGWIYNGLKWRCEDIARKKAKIMFTEITESESQYEDIEYDERDPYYTYVSIFQKLELTEIQKKVIDLLEKGKKADVIAKELGVTPREVSVIRQSIIKKARRIIVAEK